MIALKLLRTVLRLRYQVTADNIEILDNSKSALIIPNHQALVDPQILITQLLPYCKVVPTVTETFYDNTLLNGIFKRWGAIRVPDLTAGSRDTAVLEKTVSACITGLNAGKNLLVYPSGQLCETEYESIKNKQSVYEIVRQSPQNARIIGVRISGLWGSQWSKYGAGETPSFITLLMKALLLIVLNFFFFMPRRKVHLQFIDLTDELKAQSQSELRDFNQYLEQFYNDGIDHTPRLVKTHFLQLAPKQPGKPETIIKQIELEDSEIDQTVFDAIKKAIAEETGENKTISLSNKLEDELGLDSLGIVNVIETVEQQLGKQFPKNIQNAKTVKHLCILAMGYESVQIEYKTSHLFTGEKTSKNVSVRPNGSILQEAWRITKSGPKEYILWDNTIGSTTRKDMMLKAYVIAEIIKKKTHKPHIAIMLPAVQSTPLLILACYIAGKVPVMLNWTVGKRNLEHCLKVSHAECILTASKFYDKVADKLPASFQDVSVMLDKEIPKLKIGTKLRGLLHYKCKTGKVVSRDEDPAVILFTSGSETSPKPVPLSHKNILSDLNGVFRSVQIPDDQVFLSFLPPFHSFGFTVFCILPLVSGARVAYTPDPTNADEIIRVITHTKANLLVGTPTFLRSIVNRAQPEELQSINFLVSGAEAMPNEFVGMVKEKIPQAYLLEGYGITECSPVLSINPLDLQKAKSVGKLLPEITSVVVDPDSFEPVPVNQEGVLLVKGPNIFNGYVDKAIASPFVEVEGKTYYNTGDMVKIDKDGYIFITGRLKRFLKSGGEMLSLPYLESVLNEKYGNQEMPALATEGIETNSGAQITLFTTKNIELSEINSYLREQGIGNVYRIKSVHQLEEIPMLGSGKIDYKQLKALC